MTFTNAIVRPPCIRLADGLTTAGLGPPDHTHALKQHAAYVDALRRNGLVVTALPADNAYPDSTFVEDPAVLLPDAVVITRPGAPSRQGETVSIEAALRQHFETIHRIEPPGTLDGGDIMAAGAHYYIGLSQRTNPNGAAQLAAILNRYGFESATVELPDGLHLKSSVVCLEANTIVATAGLANMPAFSDYHRIVVPAHESYAANCLWINGVVLVAAGYPVTAAAVADAGYPVEALDMSEFRKLDGGLSCLSLRFESDASSRLPPDTKKTRRAPHGPDGLLIPRQRQAAATFLPRSETDTAASRRTAGGPAPWS